MFLISTWHQILNVAYFNLAKIIPRPLQFNLEDYIKHKFNVYKKKIIKKSSWEYFSLATNFARQRYQPPISFGSAINYKFRSAAI